MSGEPQLVSDVVSLSTPDELDPDTIHRARLAVCANAHSLDEANEMLKMLGLI